jgi:hypothetical protein
MVTVPSLVDETPLDQYTATGSQTDFNFTYMIFATEDIKVYVNDVLKTETTDYVVKQSDGSAIVPADDLPMDGGKVVFNSGLTSGDKVSLSRDIAIERLTGYSVAGAFRADVVNAEFTKLYAVQQQLERDISRTLRLSASDAEGGSLELPTNRASKFLAFDANGDMIASAGSIGTTPIVVSSFMETVLDDTTAAAARTTLAAQQDVITTRGDIVRGSSSAVAERLALGTAEQILKSDGTDLTWGAYQDASETVKGIGELATQAEVDAWTDTGRLITPATLAGRNIPCFRAYLSSGTQSITNSTWTKVTLDAESFDTNSWFDSTTNYRFTPLKAGYYRVNITTFFSSLTNRYQLSIYKNGSAVSNMSINATGDSGGTHTDIVYLNGSSDYIEFYVYHFSSGARNINGGTAATYMSANLIA